jgi:hypothetical protein
LNGDLNLALKGWQLPETQERTINDYEFSDLQLIAANGIKKKNEVDIYGK